MATSPPSSSSSRKALATSIHISALDGIVHVNSIFTLAVFLGLAWNPRDPSNSLIDSSNPTCYAVDSSIAESMVAFHVYSFGCFLFSSLVALGLKQAIQISAYYESYRAHVHKSGLRLGMLASAFGSVFGSVFLMLALVDVVQIKLGTLSCGSSHSFAAVMFLFPVWSIVPTLDTDVMLSVSVQLSLLKAKIKSPNNVVYFEMGEDYLGVQSESECCYHSAITLYLLSLIISQITP